MNATTFKDLKEALKWCDVTKAQTIVEGIETEYITSILFNNEYNYFTENVLTDLNFKETRELISASWYASKLTPVIKEFGYDRVNKVLQDIYEARYEQKVDND